MASKKSSLSLANAVKQLIAQRGGPVSPQAGITGDRIRSELDKLQKQTPLSSTSALKTLAIGTFITLNSPFALQQLWQWTSRSAQDAELLREAGLKCISFIGIAKVINNLGILHDCFVKEGLELELNKKSRRDMWSEAARPTFSRGRQLWDSIYEPHAEKLVKKLSSYHPDLPVHILESHYSLLLSDPDPSGPLGRTLTSVLAIACLQSQTGVGSQTTSHVFGLRKALAEPFTGDDLYLKEEDRAWLAGDTGNEWILTSIETLRKLIEAQGSGVIRAKL